MRAQEITFLNLVQGEKQFQVPLYQRTYSWGRPQLRQLWDDVLELVESQQEGRRPAPHFLGSVVLAPGQIQAGGVQRWLVVDGQQRLTTLMLALTALRDHLRMAGQEKHADRIHRQFLVNEFQDGDEHYRLLPTQADRSALIDTVAGSPRAGSGDNIGVAYRFFLGALTEGASAGEHAPDPADWAGTVETALKDLLSIVEITAEPDDNVYRIFESLNNTGVGLSQSDLLRNYVFMRLPTRGERVYNELWLPMQQRLGPKNLELLVWLDLVVRGNVRARQTDIYRDQQQRLDPVSGDEAALESEIATLAERGERLLRILEPEREPHRGLRTVLERLARWGGQTHFPLALHLFDLMDAGECDGGQVAEALTYVESFFVRRLLCQASTTGFNRQFMELPSELERDRPVAEAVRRTLSAKRTAGRVWPSDTDVREAIRSKPFYYSGRPYQKTYVLRRLEESYGGSEPVDFDKAKLTLEHVLPQRPASEWLDHLAEETEPEQSPRELHELLVHTLGNMTLSADNVRLSNSPFDRKQQILDSSALRMNRSIADQERWGKAEILARADELAQRATELWPGPIGGVREAEAEPAAWAELRSALIAMPAGTWTTYGALAELVGSGPRAVGGFLSGKGAAVHGAHRVLMSDGRVSPVFQRSDGEPTTLEAEGVPFDARGRAHPSHQLTADDLATLLGKDIPDSGLDEPVSDAETAAAAERFESQLHANHPDAAPAALSLLRFWERQGGHRDYGRATETSCFVNLDAGTPLRPHILRPFTLYPVSGTAEVLFEYLKTRAPFDDAALRRELLGRLNEIDGIELAEAKLELRPSIPLETFASRSEDICAVLEWFVHTVALYVAQQPE